jgi:hypothetical protein
MCVCVCVCEKTKTPKPMNSFFIYDNKNMCAQTSSSFITTAAKLRFGRSPSHFGKCERHCETMSEIVSEQIVARSDPDEETIARANSLKEAGNALFAGT